MWTRRSNRAFEYLTQRSAMPRVVRAPAEPEPKPGERPSERILRIIESEGWAAHADPDLLDFLAEVDVEGQVPPKMQELIAEVLYFCWELDQPDDALDDQ